MTTNEDYSKMLSRMIKAIGPRLTFNAEDLLVYKKLQKDLDEAIAFSVHSLRGQGHSWEYIARGLGVTRQYAFQKWGKQ